jgi:hypothetical protein
MKETDIHVFAREFRETHGPKALAVASQKVQEFDSQGNEQEAATWRRITAVLREMRGPHES